MMSLPARARSSTGRAPRLQRGCCGFKSHRVHYETGVVLGNQGSARFCFSGQAASRQGRLASPVRVRPAILFTRRQVPLAPQGQARNTGGMFL